MNYDKFQMILFSYIPQNKQTKEINKPTEGVVSMIPALAVTAYILNIKYDNLKEFFNKNKNYCLKFEKFFDNDYERYLEILRLIKNSNIVEKLHRIDFNGKFYTVDIDKPLESYKFINKYVAEILKIKDIILTDKLINDNRIYYNIEFLSGKLSTDNLLIYEQIVKQIKSLKKSHKNIISDINVISTLDNHIMSTIYIKPSFNVKEFIKLVDKLKNEFNVEKYK